MENFMKIDENFVVNFLTKIMKGTISSKEKEMLKIYSQKKRNLLKTIKSE